MSDQQNPQQPPSPQADDSLVQVFDRCLQNQAEELNIRRSELSIRERESQNQLEYSKQVVVAQLEDRRDER
jgi:hypothetical protein